jgi:hypothetical protein
MNDADKGKDTEAFDLDGTLAQDLDGDYDPSKIGEPVAAMVNRIKGFIKAGTPVVIFTARVHEPGAFPHIKKWLREHDLPDLPITNRKQPNFRRIWDDRAVAVERNTGKILGGESEESWEDEARKALK